MVTWELVDSIDPVDAPELFPRVVIHSEAQLRHELHRLVMREPAIVGLNSSGTDGLQIGIGGRFAGIRWAEYPGSLRGRTVISDRTYCEERIDFTSEGDSISFWPNELIPAELAVEIIVYFYIRHQLPEWIAWKEWDPELYEWIIKPARGAPAGSEPDGRSGPSQQG